MNTNVRINYTSVLIGFLAGYLACLMFFHMTNYGPSSQSPNVMYKPQPRPHSGLKVIESSEVVENKDNDDGGTWKSSDGAFYPESLIAKDHEDWKQKNCFIKELENNEDFFNYITTRTLNCYKPVMLGGGLRKYRNYNEIVGEKWVCMSEKYNIKKENCIVLSFGIAQDWTFDDDISTKYGCQVYAFDPTIKLPDHNRSDHIHFYNLGIAGQTRGRLYRYIDVLKKLHLENATIDFLKLDVEGYEMGFFEDVLYDTPNLLKNVKMISMEVHSLRGKDPRGPHKSYWKYFQRLDCLGFKIWFSEINPVRGLHYRLNGKVRGCCYEIVWSRDRQW